MPNGRTAPTNLYIPRNTDDQGTPTDRGSTVFYQSASLGLVAIPNDPTQNESYFNPNNGLSRDIGVTVHLIDPSIQYQSVTVQVWLSRPVTNFAPGNGYPNLELIAGDSIYVAFLTIPFPPSPPGSTPTPLTFPLYFDLSGQFLPNPSDGTHCCLIGNVFGTQLDGTPEGNDYTVNQAYPFDASNDSYPQNGPQHNIFDDSVGGDWKLNFGFLAASNLTSGREDVSVEILHFTGPAALTARDLSYLHGSRFSHLPLHPGTHPVKDYVIHGFHDGHHHHHRHCKLGIHAKTTVPLQVELEFDPRETKGAVHSFGVIQKDASGQIQGGISLFAVVAH